MSAPTTPASAAGAPNLGSDPADSAKWCEAYAAIAANLAALGQTPEDAASGVGLLTTFDRLWLSAGQLGLVTPEEVEANRAAGKGYGEIMALVADGASEEEIRAAQASFTAATEEMRGPLTSSSTKITEACQLGSPSASPPPRRRTAPATVGHLKRERHVVHHDSGYPLPRVGGTSSAPLGLASAPCRQGPQR